ncbi:hypothetical protein KIPB_015491, partial [Kipferlia bialata]|eukprot:g15491.t1
MIKTQDLYGQVTGGLMGSSVYIDADVMVVGSS